MIALEDNSILVGQIKQLLHDFNLPRCQIGRSNPQPNAHFIVESDIYRWDENLNEVHVSKYSYNRKYLNITGNLKIENMIYDRYTHRYLGKFLRFIRDYNQVDLMSMYNCADGESIRNPISISANSSTSLYFDPNDSAFITYQIPISYGVELTLYLHSLQTFEVCLFPVPQISSLSYENTLRNKLALATYKKVHSNDVVYYNPTEIALNYIENMDDNLYAKNEAKNFLNKYWDQLYLLIRVPRSTTSSLVVLEGKYYIKNYTELEYIRYQPCANIPITHREIIDAEVVKKYYYALGKYEPEQLVRLSENPNGPYYYSYLADAGFRINCQLLSYENQSAKYLLADRLIEYLTNNAINPISIPAEIKRLQKTLDNTRNQYDLSQYFYTRDNSGVDYESFYVQGENSYDDPIPFMVTSSVIVNQYRPRDRQYGIWNYLDHQDLKSIIYYSELQLQHDVLGYLDKDIENIIQGDLDDAEV